MIPEAQRVGIFVDVQNMFYSAKSLYSSKIDYNKFLDKVLAGRSLVRAIAYVVQKADVDQTSFKDALSRMGYELRVKELKIREDSEGRTRARGNWNVGMAVDILNIASRLDVVVLCTGDSEMVPVVRSLQQHGVRVEICSFPESTGHLLKKMADSFVHIPDECIFKEKKFENDDHYDKGLGSTEAGGVDHSGLPEDVEEEVEPVSLDIY